MSDDTVIPDGVLDGIEDIENGNTATKEDIRQAMTDVEIYIKKVGAKTDDLSIGYPYEDVAKMDNNQLARTVTLFNGWESGQWEVGLRERGKEPISSNFEITKEEHVESCKWMAVQFMRDVVSEWRSNE